MGKILIFGKGLFFLIEIFLVNTLFFFFLGESFGKDLTQTQQAFIFLFLPSNTILLLDKNKNNIVKIITKHTLPFLPSSTILFLDKIKNNIVLWSFKIKREVF